ncbi:MAG: DUF1427 family protein [Pseudomonadota bacterium]
MGVLCRFTGIPVPAPPVLVDAMLVVAKTSGYLLVDRLAAERRCENRKHCGGQSGEHYD